MARAIILLLDSFGVGATADADKYGDAHANTFGHIAQWCVDHKIALQIPNLLQLGLGECLKISCGEFPAGLAEPKKITALYGCAAEVSKGKDTPSGHWEIAGVPVTFDWGYFATQIPCFPPELMSEFIKQAKLPGVLGNKHASGTEIINEFGDEHSKTGMPIVYTSGDSVFQIAAHEQHFGVQRLYEVCEVARKLVDQYNIGRVIARPFLGEKGNYYRTGNRRDLATLPPTATLLEQLVQQGGTTIAIGKTADIFAHQGISEEIHADGNDALFTATINAMQKNTADKTLIFSNFVDFDSKYGHRRDVEGYAAALEAFDRRLPELQKLLLPDDLVIITADHGCDPTMPGSDHTRENIPILAFGPHISHGSIGKRECFADIGQSIAQHLAIKSLAIGKSFLPLPLAGEGRVRV